MNALSPTSEKNNTSGHMSLTTVAWNFFDQCPPTKSGFAATMIAVFDGPEGDLVNQSESGCESGGGRGQEREIIFQLCPRLVFRAGRIAA